MLDGHKTSVTLEDAFWDAFKEIAAAQGTSVSRLIAALDSERRERLQFNLSSAVRLFVLKYYRSRCRPERKETLETIHLGKKESDGDKQT